MKLRYSIHRSLSLIYVLSHMGQVHALLTDLFKIHFNIILL